MKNKSVISSLTLATLSFGAISLTPPAFACKKAVDYCRSWSGCTNRACDELGLDWNECRNFKDYIRGNARYDRLGNYKEVWEGKKRTITCKNNRACEAYKKACYTNIESNERWNMCFDKKLYGEARCR